MGRNQMEAYENVISDKYIVAYRIHSDRNGIGDLKYETLDGIAMVQGFLTGILSVSKEYRDDAFVTVWYEVISITKG